MLVIVGFVIIVVSIVVGYVAHGGNLIVLFQWTEIIIIFGAGIGSLIMANSMTTIKGVMGGIGAALKGRHVGRQAYMETLSALFDLFQMAQREGVIALEAHIEKPESSSVFGRYKSLQQNAPALTFLCDTFKVVLNGGIEPHELEDLMDNDLEIMHHHEMQPSHAVTTVADAMPGLGIVAAVLGVVITMGKIDQPPAIIGYSIAAALVGTFLGVFAAYGLFGPLAKAMEHQAAGNLQLVHAIKTAILAFARNAPPIIAVEYARRSIPPDVRPTFQETEQAIKKR